MSQLMLSNAGEDLIKAHLRIQKVLLSEGTTKAQAQTVKINVIDSCAYILIDYTI